MKLSTKNKLQRSLDLAKEAVREQSAQVAKSSRQGVRKKLQLLARNLQPIIARVEGTLER